MRADASEIAVVFGGGSWGLIFVGGQILAVRTLSWTFGYKKRRSYDPRGRDFSFSAGAEDGSRTRTRLPSAVFKTAASAIPPLRRTPYMIVPDCKPVNSLARDLLLGCRKLLRMCLQSFTHN